MSDEDPKYSPTGRVMRYFNDHPQTRLSFWTGTIQDKSMKSYGSLGYLFDDISYAEIEWRLLHQMAALALFDWFFGLLEV